MNTNETTVNRTHSLSLPVTIGGTYELIVIGGGPSGSVAAIAAARCGVRVLLVEQYGFLGGGLTAMGVGPMMSFHNGAGEQLVKGIPDEIVNRLAARGASSGHIVDSTTYCSTVTPFDSEELKIELETLLTEAGGEILYHTQLAAAQVEGDRLASVVLCNKAGLTSYAAKAFIDATGDADLAVRSGADTRFGRETDGLAQPMTMNFKVANVDVDAIRSQVISHPENFRFEHGQEEGLRRLPVVPRLSLFGFFKEWHEAQRTGEVDVPREGVLMFETPQPGVVIVNTSRINGLRATSPSDLSRAEMEGRRQCRQIFDFLKKHIAGFANAIYLGTPAKIGVRESRHVRALHQLDAGELIESRPCADPVALGGYPIDIHIPGGGARPVDPGTVYQIPLRSLLPERPRNLVLAGRCIGATHRAAGGFRVTPIVMAIGQAAGVVAAESVLKNLAPADVPYPVVRRRLLEQGAKLPAS
ncbi:Glucose inhibited division protein A [Opitutaceae bacterium TAV1]|nr:Glucose inhibited division protein A [Opitutaceae bacterium TAV1]